MTVLEQQTIAKAFLKEHGIQTPSQDTNLFLMAATSLTKTQLYTKNQQELTKNQQETMQTYLQKRIKGMPVAYILNQCEFMGLPFYVNENTLIPRPDTEILVEKALSILCNQRPLLGLEIGTGSGCIAICLSYFLKNLRLLALDISSQALAVAKKNAIHHCVFHKIAFAESDLFKNLPEQTQNSFDFIVSNPPYIETETIKTLDINVKDYEPHLALDGGFDGLKCYRNIIKKASVFLKHKGHIFLEIGYNQQEVVSSLLHSHGFTDINAQADYAGLPRVLTAICIKE